MKKQISVLVADENKEGANKLKKYLEQFNEIKYIDVAIGGEETLNKTLNSKPDVVVLDVLLSGIDGYAIIEEAKIRELDTKFIVVSSLSSETFVQKAMSLNVAYYMVKPVSNELIYKRISDVLAEQEIKNNYADDSNALFYETAKLNKQRQVEEKITNIFITVGIPAHIKGYHFLREAIKMAIETPDIVNAITKKLYPSIAERFDTSASKVERAIRHAIEVAWNRGKIENINNIFGVKVYTNNEKPTNGEFIALLADKMLIEG